MRVVDVLLEKVEESLGRVPALERNGMVLRAASVEKPDAALGPQLAQEGSAVRREEERHLVRSPRAPVGKGLVPGRVLHGRPGRSLRRDDRRAVCRTGWTATRERSPGHADFDREHMELTAFEVVTPEHVTALRESCGVHGHHPLVRDRARGHEPLWNTMHRLARSVPRDRHAQPSPVDKASQLPCPLRLARPVRGC